MKTSKPKHVPLPWIVGYGSGLTGPNTPTNHPCVDTKWPYIPISQDKHTIAIIPAQESGKYSYQPESKKLLKDRTDFIVQACNSHHKLLEVCKTIATQLLEAIAQATE